MNRPITGREALIVGGIWLVTMVTLAHLPECSALAEPPPVIVPLQRRPNVESLPRPAVHVEEVGGMCEMPSGPSPTMLGVLIEEPITEHERQVVERKGLLVPVLQGYVDVQPVPVYAVTAGTRHRLPKIKAKASYTEQRDGIDSDAQWNLDPVLIDNDMMLLLAA